MKSLREKLKQSRLMGLLFIGFLMLETSVLLYVLPLATVMSISSVFDPSSNIVILLFQAIAIPLNMMVVYHQYLRIKKQWRKWKRLKK